ncbi:MAG: Mov34/MPN/PAD-1 family protein, partial [Thermoplasmata archaeon]
AEDIDTTLEGLNCTIQWIRAGMNYVTICYLAFINYTQPSYNNTRGYWEGSFIVPYNADIANYSFKFILSDGEWEDSVLADGTLRLLNNIPSPPVFIPTTTYVLNPTIQYTPGFDIDGDRTVTMYYKIGTTQNGEDITPPAQGGLYNTTISLPERLRTYHIQLWCVDSNGQESLRINGTITVDYMPLTAGQIEIPDEIIDGTYTSVKTVVSNPATVDFTTTVALYITDSTGAVRFYNSTEVTVPANGQKNVELGFVADKNMTSLALAIQNTTVNMSSPLKVKVKTAQEEFPWLMVILIIAAVIVIIAIVVAVIIYKKRSEEKEALSQKEQPLSPEGIAGDPSAQPLPPPPPGLSDSSNSPDAAQTEGTDSLPPPPAGVGVSAAPDTDTTAQPSGGLPPPEEKKGRDEKIIPASSNTEPAPSPPPPADDLAKSLIMELSSDETASKENLLDSLWSEESDETVFGISTDLLPSQTLEELIKRTTQPAETGSTSGGTGVELDQAVEPIIPDYPQPPEEVYSKLDVGIEGRLAQQEMEYFYNVVDVYIHKDVVKKIMAHAEELAQKKLECMGFLVGDAFSWQKRKYTLIRDVVTTELDSTSVSVRFARDGFGMLFAQLDKLPYDYLILGWYHSHPGYSCFFSYTDIATQRAMFKNPYQCGIVVDPIRGEMKAFKLKGESYQELNYSIFDGEFAMTPKAGAKSASADVASSSLPPPSPFPPPPA